MRKLVRITVAGKMALDGCDPKLAPKEEMGISEPTARNRACNDEIWIQGAKDFQHDHSGISSMRLGLL